jgi:hypothetical protein
MRRDLEKRGGVFHFKEFSENPSLLNRYLNSQVGRLWDTVYSEICSNPDSRRSIGQRILQKINRAVATDCFIENRQVLQPGWWSPHPPSGLYVHPKTGLLCRPRPRRYERDPPEATRVVIDDLSWYEKIAGIWYRLDHELRSTAWFGVPREETVLSRKKQCSKRELKKIAEAMETGRGAYVEQTLYGKTRWIPVAQAKR